MSDEHKDNEQEGVVIDVTPEPEPEPAPQPEPTAPAKNDSTSKLPLALAALSLLLVIGAFAFAYQYTRQTANDFAIINQRLSDSLRQQDALQKQLDAAQAAVAQQTGKLADQQTLAAQQQQDLSKTQARFEQQEQLLDQERLRMQSREAELRATVADVHKRVGASGTQWMVAEAEYLMRIANARLTLARDAGTARAALLLADQRLRDTKDPGWNPVRDQIARDMAALDAAKLPDSAGIVAKLGAMAGQVPKLHLARATLGGPKRTNKAQTAPRSQRNWDTLLDDLWAGFKDTVRIRRNDKPVQAMLAPEQQYFLYENLRLQLESARLAVARSDAELYLDGLNTAASWLTANFDPEDALTQRLHTQALELAAINIRPPLPDISQSLRSLQLRKKLNADLARSMPLPTPPETPLAPEPPVSSEAER